MNPREEIYKKGLENAKKSIIYFQKQLDKKYGYDAWLDCYVDSIDKALREASNIKDGPSDEDKRRLTLMLKYCFPQNNTEENLKWALSKLKEAWGKE